MEKLQENLEQMYLWYAKARKKLEGRDDFLEGKFAGALEALGAVYMSTFGGEAMTKLWMMSMEIKDDENV